MYVSSKEVVERFLVTFSCINLRIDCLHTIQFVLGRLTQLQECAESEREIIEVLVNLALNLVLSRLRLIAMNKCQALASLRRFERRGAPNKRAFGAPSQ